MVPYHSQAQVHLCRYLSAVDGVQPSGGRTESQSVRSLFFSLSAISLCRPNPNPREFVVKLREEVLTLQLVWSTTAYVCIAGP